MSKEIELAADESYAEARHLSAGIISLQCEEGRLRYLSVKDVELVRMIYPAVRDQHWSTVPPNFSDVHIIERLGSFSIRYVATYTMGDIDFRAQYIIEGTDDSTIVFSMHGKALSRFERRRIGLCALHPVPACLGKDIEVTQPDNSTYSAAFPADISPFQPFLNLKKMKWLAAEGLLATLTFEGDVFETEDQRNWSDNSFKTYSTPLSLPAPVVVNIGDTVTQKITLHVEGKTTAISSSPGVRNQEPHPLPKIGYSRSPDQQPLTTAQLGHLAHLPFDHYSIHLPLSGEWQPLFSKALEEAVQLQTHLEITVDFEQVSDAELDSFASVLRQNAGQLASIGLAASDRKIVPLERYETAYHLLKRSLPAIPIGYATTGNFADLNRNRPADLPFDFVSFTLQPQVHMSDSRSIMENVDSHPYLIDTARKFAAGKPVHVSAISFSGNKNDKRFATDFAAWWTLQALSNLTGAASVTFYHLRGEEGLLHGDQATPVYRVLKECKNFSATQIVPHAGSKVVLENAAGDRLVFHSKLPRYDA